MDQINRGRNIGEYSVITATALMIPALPKLYKELHELVLNYRVGGKNESY